MSSEKPFTWKEIKGFLIKELKKYDSIMTFGTIGSYNLENDIDIIITKKPGKKTLKFYRQIHSIYNSLDSYLKKKYNGKAIRFSTSEEQYLVQCLTHYGKNDLMLHTMVYESFPQIEMDWGRALSRNVNIKKILIENYKCLKGSIKDLKNKDFNKKGRYDNVHIYLHYYDKINSHYPLKLFIEAMNHHLDYLFRKRLGINYKYSNNRKGIIKKFYKLCETLDELDNTKVS